MPNIIAIIDDQKIREQIESFIKELDSENTRLRFFTTGFEFEMKYFSAKKTPKSHPLQILSGLEKYSFDSLESSLEFGLTTNVSPLQQNLTLIYNTQTLKIERIEPSPEGQQKIWGLSADALIQQTNIFSGMISKLFIPHWLKFIDDIQVAKTQVALPLKTSNHEITWYKITGQQQNANSLRLDFLDVTGNYKSALEHERARKIKQEAESSELQLLSEIDLIIFKSDCVSGKSQRWIDLTWNQMKEAGLFPKEKTPRFVAIKYEDDGVEKSELFHPRLDDLIYLPFDRLIFLQKLQIIFGLPTKIQPKYLFTQPAQDKIEISKSSQLELLSDLGIAVRNPVPLKENLLAHFYIYPKDEPNPIAFWGKVILSEPHPTIKNEYLVTFSFFGIEKSVHTKIKNILSKNGKFSPFINPEREEFLFNPDEIYYEESDKRFYNVGIIHLDEHWLNQYKQSLPKDIDQTKFVIDGSYAGFSSRFFQSTKGPSLSQILPANQDELFSPSILFTVNFETLDILHIETPPGDSHLYFSEPAVDVFSSGRRWLTPFLQQTHNDEMLFEMARLAKAGHKTQRMMITHNKKLETRLVVIEMRSHETKDSVSVMIRLPKQEDLGNRQAADRISGLDLMVIDSAFIPGGNISTFVEAVQNKAKESNLLKNRPLLRFIILCDNENLIRHRDWDHPQVYGVVVKPFEARQLSFLIANALGNRFSVYHLKNIGWRPIQLPTFIASDTKLNQLSEFGAEIEMSRPMAPGTLLHLRGGIFNNAPGQCLAARFYHCEESKTQKGSYICSATYFGINDQFMKFARKWFLETYATSKENQNNS